MTTNGLNWNSSTINANFPLYISRLIFNTPIANREQDERHKMLLWKVLNDIIPAKDRIKKFVPLQELDSFSMWPRY